MDERPTNRYVVRIPEVHTSYRIVNAKDSQSAIVIALDDPELEVLFEYSHTLKNNIDSELLEQIKDEH